MNEIKDTKKSKQTYTRDEMFSATIIALNLGMTLRQDQLNGFDPRSGNEVHKEWFDKNYPK